MHTQQAPPSPDAGGEGEDMEKRQLPQGLHRWTYLDRQDLGAIHLTDDSATEEGNSSTSTA